MPQGKCPLTWPHLTNGFDCRGQIVPPPPCPCLSYGNVPNQYGPYAYCTARSSEVHFFSHHGLIDSDAVRHAGRAEDFPLEGWTWGFPSQIRKATSDPTGTPESADAQDLDRRRRMDRISVPFSFQDNITEAYTALCASDKIVALSLFPTPKTGSRKRATVPTSFLADEDAVHSTEDALRTPSTTGQCWRESAMREMKKRAFHFERVAHCAAVSEGKALLMQSTNHILPPEACAF